MQMFNDLRHDFFHIKQVFVRFYFAFFIPTGSFIAIFYVHLPSIKYTQMDIFGQTPLLSLLFFILYGVTGAVPVMAALYLQFRRGNAFAPGVTPPLRLRRWATAFYSVAALQHVWWLFFYLLLRPLHSMDTVIRSAGYVAVVVLDSMLLLTTIAGTLLSMLQDRRRRVWFVFVAMIPFVVMGCVFMFTHSQQILFIAPVYVLFLYVLFTVYMVFAVRSYSRWLNDNYADLENKKVWLSQTVTLVCLLAFILYTLVDIDSIIYLFFMHFTELLLFGLLLWRVETLPQLDSMSADEGYSQPSPVAVQGADVTEQTETPGATPPILQTTASPVNIELVLIEQQLAEHCVATQLYLQHNLTLLQLAHAIGTNRSYLSQYFSRQGITYNIYINNLRINHFISRYQEATRSGQQIVAQQLAQESGFRSYSTFARAFMSRTGQSVTAWMRDAEG